jgi:hypothetical protein
VVNTRTTFPILSNVLLQANAPVPGGDQNCVRCRWFVTDPHSLPALAAHFNKLAYRFDEARNKALANEETLQQLKGSVATS